MDPISRIMMSSGGVKTYAISSDNTVNEGSSLSCTVTTANVADGTTLYWTINNITTVNADFTSNSGSFTITSDTGTFNVPIAADLTTEGSESFSVEVRKDSSNGTIVAQSGTVVIYDTSNNSTYSFSSASSVDEGSSLACTVTTTNVINGTTLYWTINHSTTVNADFTSASGSFVINSNSGTFSIPIASDSTNDHAEAFAVDIRIGSITGAVVETSDAITINNIFFDDLSNYTFITAEPVNIVGQAFSCFVSPDGTKLYTSETSTTNNLIRQQTLSVPFDVTSHGSATTRTISSAEAAEIYTLFFKPDGTRLWIGQGLSSDVEEFTLSTAWDISTLSHNATYNFESPTAYTDTVIDFIFSHDGTKCFTVDSTQDNIRRYDLDTAWDLSSGFTATSVSVDLDLITTANATRPNHLAFSRDGYKLYLLDDNTSKILQYDLSSPYDITSSSLSGTPDDELDMSSQDASFWGMRMSTDGRYIYAVGRDGDDINVFRRPPTYSLTRAANNVDEGSSLTFTVTTTAINDGTTVYWKILTNTSDFSVTSGTATINSNTGSFTVTPTEDNTTEGSENFTVALYSDSAYVFEEARFVNTVINDTSLDPPTYSFSSASSVSEGDSLSCSVTTTSVSNGTTLYWTINHGTTTSADFTSTSGSFAINSNSGTFSISIASDSVSDANETFTVQIRTGSTSGTIVETSNTITIDETNFADISNYSHTRFDAINIIDNAYGVEFNPSGTTIYTLDFGTVSANVALKQQTLSTAWDISTHGSAINTVNVYGASTFTSPTDFKFKPDGTKMWISNVFGEIRQYSLSTAWDISTMGSHYERDFATRIHGFCWKPDGTALFYTDGLSDKITKREFQTAWDTSSTITSTTTSIELDLATTANDTATRGINFSPDGLKIYLVGVGNDKIYMYNLSTAWDITSSSLSGTPDDSLSIGTQETGPQCITFSPDGKYFYVAGLADDGIDQFTRT